MKAPWTPASVQIYWLILPLVVAISLVYSASRHEAWRRIWCHSLRLCLWIMGLLVARGHGDPGAALEIVGRPVVAAYTSALHRFVDELGLHGAVTFSGGLSDAELRAAMAVDKKARGARLRLVVLDGLARPGILDDPPEQLLRQAYQEVSN